MEFNMSFAINPTLNHIDILEPYIIEMYRSAKEVLLPGARFRGHPCEAYICISKIEKTMKAYVALLEMELNSVFVYTSDFATDNSADYPKVIAEANEFASSIGFSMERVNLNFSPAMREVIIKGFRVMKAPQKKPLLRSMDGYPQLAKTSSPTLPSTAEKSVVSTVQKESLAAELKRLQSDLAAAKADIEKLTREKLSFEQSSAREISTLASSLEKAAELKRLGEEKSAAEIEALKKDKIEFASLKDDALAASLKAELDSTRRKAELAEKALAAQTTALQEEIGTLKSRNILLEQQLTAEKSSTGEKISRLLAGEKSAASEIAALKSSAEKAAEIKRRCDENHAQEIEALKKEKSEDASRKEVALAAALKAELDSARLKAELAENSLAARIAALQETIEALESRNITLEQQLSAEKSSAGETISRLTAEKESINALLAAEKTAAADKIAALALFETSWREGQQREEDLCRNIDLMKEQLDLLEAELAASRQKESEGAAFILKIAALEKEIAASGIEIERLGNATIAQTAFQAELKSLAEAKNDVEAEYIRLANEAMQKETEMFDALYTADAEIVRLSREIELRTQTAEAEKTALEEELKQLRLSGTLRANAVAAAMPVASATVVTAAPQVEAVKPLTVTPLEPRTETETDIIAASIPAGEPILPAEAMEDDTSDAAVIGDPEITNGLLNEFGSFCGSSGHSTTEFTIDPTITTVGYSDPAEIVAILHSNNTVQAVPDGSRMQRCEGYVIATRKEGEYRTYVAWYLTESKKVIVCTPEQQPADSRECTQILQDAITYFEIVGFMMELEDLGSTVKSYRKAIRKVPALSRK